MKVLLPETVDATTLASSNVAETVAPYSAGTSYALGAQVRDDATHKLFESLVTSNLGNPLTDTTKWLDLGLTNRWGMFDQKLGTLTSQAEAITCVFAFPGRISGVALFGLDAASVTVTVADATDGVVFDQTFDLTSQDNVNDYYDYCFQPVIRRTEIFVDGLPPYAGATITVTITNPGATAVCGNLVLGVVRALGATAYGAGLGIIDYSRKEADAWGNVDLVQRDYRNTGSFSVSVDRAMVGEVKRVLTVRRGKPTVFIGSEQFSSMLIYGFARDWDVKVASYPLADLTLELESLN